MEEKCWRLKGEKVLQPEVMAFLVSKSSTNAGKSWEELKEFYEINEENFTTLFGYCNEWIKVHLYPSKSSTLKLPLKALSYLTWIHEAKMGSGSGVQSKMPWKIVSDGPLLEGLSSFSKYTEQWSVGVLVLETILQQPTEHVWNTESFGKVFRAILELNMEAESFGLVVFLSVEKVSCLLQAINEIGFHFSYNIGSYKRDCDDTNLFENALCDMVIAGVVHKSLDYDIHNVLPGNKPTITYDSAEMESDENEEKEAEEENNATRDPHFLSSLIQYLCRPDQCIIDAFTNGVACIESLSLKRQALVFVSNQIEETEVIGKCSKLVSDSKEIRLWAKLEEEANPPEQEAPLPIEKGPIGLQNISDIQDAEAWMQMMATKEAGQKAQ